MKQMPKNNSKTAVFRRWLPYGNVDNRWIEGSASDAPADFNAKHLLTEGVTPSSDTITPVDITVQLQQYGMLYSFTDQTFDLYEDDIPQAISKQLGARMGMLQEMIDYSALKACTNKFYGGGGSTRASVNKAIDLNILRKAARNLYLNHADMVTEIIKPSPNYDTRAVPAAYIVAVSTDVLADIRDLPGFVPAEKYGNMKPVHIMEKGACEEFRFVVSPELVPIQDAGAPVGTTGLVSTSGSNVDVYPCIVCGQEAWGKLALRGTKGFQPYYHPVDKADKSDALAQRGYSGAKMYAASTILNNGWMAVLEVGVTAL
jgi:N4-gp56 family major capsid protein